MVSVTTWYGKPNTKISEIVGLSTDEKPIEKFGDIVLCNGSTFFCMDTSDTYMYDQQNKVWWKL